MHPPLPGRREGKEKALEPPISLERLATLGAIRQITPAYLTVADYPWLRALLDERARFVGQKRREWKVRISESLPVQAPRGKLNVALGVLDRLCRDEALRSLSPRKIRAVVFRQAAQGADRAGALVRAAAILGTSPEGLSSGLLADLPDERTLTPLPASLAPAELALASNGVIVASLLARALRVRIVARGQVRSAIRHVRLMGLLCHAAPGARKDEVMLEISGPFALFRHTRIYGRALASLVPRLAWCNSYRLEADCVLGGGTTVGRLVLCSGDPVAPAREPKPFDSKVEERFARAFAKLAREWDVIREPEAIGVGGSLIFPDFELRHRVTAERWLLEIVGYWTPKYVRRKLAQLRAARIERLILCIDEARSCADELLEIDARVIRYKRKLDPRAVLAIVDPALLKALAASPQGKRVVKPSRREAQSSFANGSARRRA